MNLKYLGDALDHWKGSLFEYLDNAGVLRGFAVDPMTSDHPKWKKPDFSLYAQLLRVKNTQIIPRRSTTLYRRRYNGVTSHSGDLFLDPDTGIATGPVTQKNQYIMPREIASLLPESTDRLLAVYQHVSRQKVSSRVGVVIDRLTEKIDGFGWCSYESGTVAMIFISRHPSRTQDVATVFKTLLGRHVVQRVRAGVRK